MGAYTKFPLPFPPLLQYHSNSVPMKKYKILISYDGTDYCGWQIQPNGLSIQECIQTALEKILGSKTTIYGAGRTDAGVHAMGQMAHFSTPINISANAIIKGLNGLIPQDIRILYAEESEPDFHARFSAQEKTYLYRVHTTPVQLPFERRFALHYTYPIDLKKLENALHYFIGTHNFLSFTNENTEGPAHVNPIRTLYELALTPTPQGFTLLFRGDGFLYKMVRNITGTLLDIARGKIPVDAPLAIFASKDRRRAMATAPPHGLTLQSIKY